MIKRSVFLALPTLAVIVWAVWHFRGFSGGTETRNATHTASTVESTPDQKPLNVSLPTAPGLEKRRYVAPLADAYRRLDPGEDGWQSEVFSSAAQTQLQKLIPYFERPEHVDDSTLGQIVDESFSCGALRPAVVKEVFRDHSFVVARGVVGENSTSSQARNQPFAGPAGFVKAIRSLTARFRNTDNQRIKLKIYRIEPGMDEIKTHVMVHVAGGSRDGPREVSTTWVCQWKQHGSTPPLLARVRVIDYEEVIGLTGHGLLYVDCTQSLMGENESYRRHLLVGTDYWRSRIPRSLGLDVVANHGLAIGDVNGDDLDDVYVCQQGGLPNRLFIQRADGSLIDATSASGADWLDYCASALLLDLDNDGDRDLVVGQESRILFMSNDGHGKFRLENQIGTDAQTFSLSAADFDQDGDLDVYVCGYNPSLADLRTRVMGEPIPYHDANNGGRNMLLQNEGGWRFLDVASQIGLHENNTRFSFAAAWEDFDNDGDVDLYVANDYGRNNLYRNSLGRFKDVAPELGVEDMSAGMSVSWADYNRDGWMDFYVSNMFSAAGNRITFQRQFKSTVDEHVRQQYQRHARGNSLFLNSGSQGFQDVSVRTGVSMGRWAWGSKFVDFNNDGWEDIVVANGFISATDTGDL